MEKGWCSWWLCDTYGIGCHCGVFLFGTEVRKRLEQNGIYFDWSEVKSNKRGNLSKINHEKDISTLLFLLPVLFHQQAESVGTPKYINMKKNIPSSFPDNMGYNSWFSYSWIKIYFTDNTPPFYFKTRNLYVEFRDGGQEVRTYWDFAADNGKGGRGAYVTNLCYKIWDHSKTGVQYYKAKSDYKDIEMQTSHISDGHVVVDSSYGIDGNCVIWLKKTNIDHIEVSN